jgi:hypothetical protein
VPQIVKPKPDGVRFLKHSRRNGRRP